MVNVIIFHFIWKITSSFAKEKFSAFDKLRHRGTIRQRHSRHCLFQTERVISPALKYILSYSFLTIKQSCTDRFWKKFQILFVVVQVDMWDGALDETAIPRPLNSACLISQYTIPRPLNSACLISQYTIPRPLNSACLISQYTIPRPLNSACLISQYTIPRPLNSACLISQYTIPRPLNSAC